MVAVTYSGARAAAPSAKIAGKTGNKAAAKGKSFFSRVYDAIAHSQMIRAERELARYRHLLPADFKLWRDEDQSPSGGW
jgi:hypothetical protein